MKISTPKITPCLWFDGRAEEAARFYVSVFKGGRMGRISHYGQEGTEIHGRAPGSVLTVEFEIAGITFVALNGGPQFTFDEAVSFQVNCDTQDEIDYFWQKLADGGEEGPCGWLKDRFGLSWQVVPTAVPKMLTDADAKKANRVFGAIMKMGKMDIAALERAYAGG